MPQESGRDLIRIRGARQNNLKGFDLDLPARRLIVITGLSGSGKSSLAFETLYAEGQRRYIETFSPYARQFFDRMDKPRVDALEGIPPAIALEQRNSVRTTRSTVGTMTEICDYLKVLWPHLARLHCRQCGRIVAKETPRDIWNRMLAGIAPTESSTTPDALVAFPLPLSEKLSLDEQLALVSRQGFQRLLVQGDVVRVDAAAARLPSPCAGLTVIQDRVPLHPSQRARFIEACEQAYHFGHGHLTVFQRDPAITSATPAHAGWTRPNPFSAHLHCAPCNLEYRDPSPALFSFNHPMGACPTCKGFGRVIAIDYDLALPDRSKTLRQGAVKPWQTGMSAECQADLIRAARQEGVPLDRPFLELSPAHQRWVIEGAPDYGEGNEWPKAWYGVKGYFRWLESKAYKMHVRVLLSRYRAYRTCEACRGSRFQPDALLWRLPLPPRHATAAPPDSLPVSRDDQTPDPAPPDAIGSLTLAGLYGLPIRDARRVIEDLDSRFAPGSKDPYALALAEVRARLAFLDEVGLGYLTLDRPTRTLSGGETQRVNLTSCLGSRLVNTLFVLDEPSVGLHPRDTARLVQMLQRLRDLGNTVVVVEHETLVMRAADCLVDLGPGHGESGGEIIAQGPLDEVLANRRSLTAAYLSGRRRIEVPNRRPVPDQLSLPVRDCADFPVAPALRDQPLPYSDRTKVGNLPALELRHVTRNNLRDLHVILPLQRLVCLTGVSGSGKTTLAEELLRLLRNHLGSQAAHTRFGVRESEHETDPDGNGDEDTGDPNPGHREAPVHETQLLGAEALGQVLLVDQAPIGRTPRSNPAVYCGAFDPIRELFARTDEARQHGLGPSAFSFNSKQGQCEQCRGAGFEKIEMQFLSDVFVRCPACEGRRYRPHLLEIKIRPDPSPASSRTPRPPSGGSALSIADVLELTVDDAISRLGAFRDPAARRAAERLRIVQDVGLGYLRLGQPVNTLSGGESQRLKLAGHLAEQVPQAPAEATTRTPPSNPSPNPTPTPTLFVFDEPTTGLHLDDVRVLLAVFQRLVDAGHSVLIIEHNLDVLKCADWLVDLGPGGGDDGGRIVVAGPPEAVVACESSHTGRALRDVLPSRSLR